MIDGVKCSCVGVPADLWQRNTLLDFGIWVSETTGESGYTCYRVRTACDCRPKLLNPTMNLTAHQRNGVLVIDGDTVKALFVYCKFCDYLNNKQHGLRDLFFKLKTD